MRLINSVQSLSHVRLFVTPWTAARMSITSFQSWLKLMSIKSVMPSNHLIFCHPLLPPSIFPSIRVLSNESVLSIRWPKYWSFSFSINPSNEFSGLISFRTIIWSLVYSGECVNYYHYLIQEYFHYTQKSTHTHKLSFSTSFFSPLICFLSPWISYHIKGIIE